MMDDSLRKLGGTCSVLLGVFYLLIGADYLLLPEPQRVGGADFLPSFAANPFLLQLQWWLFVVAGMAGVAVVLAISQTVQSANPGWVRWTSTLAIAGFIVGALGNLQLLAYWNGWAAEYRTITDATQAAQIVEQTGILSLDPYGWFGFGMIGLWVLVVSFLALRGGALPRSLAYLGIGVGVVYWLVVAGFSFDTEMLVAIAAGLGGIILAPIWYIWAGLSLRQGAPARGPLTAAPAA
jgi:hypothetical protein